jgi:hypothetical protein
LPAYYITITAYNICSTRYRSAAGVRFCIQMVPGFPSHPSFCFLKVTQVLNIGRPRFVFRRHQPFWVTLLLFWHGYPPLGASAIGPQWVFACFIQIVSGLLGHPPFILARLPQFCIDVHLRAPAVRPQWVSVFGIQIVPGLLGRPSFSLQRWPRICIKVHLEHPLSAHERCPRFVFKSHPACPVTPPCVFQISLQICIPGVCFCYSNDTRVSGSPSFILARSLEFMLRVTLEHLPITLQ